MKNKTKLILSAMLLALTTIMSTSVFAAEGADKIGDVPTTADAITIDGEKDAIYDQGLKVDINKLLAADQKDIGTHGTAYLVWSGADLYAFVDVVDNELCASDAEKQAAEPWVMDNVEFLVDKDNGGTFAVQHRINLDGFKNYQEQGGESINSPDTDAYYLGAGKRTDGGYTAEYKITADAAANKNVGLMIMVTDQFLDGTQSNYMLKEGVGPWDVANYNYITLSDKAVTAVVAEPEVPAVEAPADTDTTAPATLDMTVISAAAMAVSGIAAVIIKKRK